MNWYLEVLKKYAVFTGRAHRKEYWMFCLFMMIIGFVLGVVGALLDVLGRSGISANFLISIYILATLIPSIAVGVRRMHDTDHSGWWLLFPFVGFVLLVMKGTRGDNRFGPESNILKREKEESSGRYFYHAEQADARAVVEARTRAIYPISEVTQKDEEFIALLKSTVKENRLEIIPDEELLKICTRARSIAAFSNTLDIELSTAINTLLEEIKKRGLSQDSKPQENKPKEIPNYEESSFKQNEAGGSSKWVYAIAIPILVAIAVGVSISYLYFSDKWKVGRNEVAVTESNYSLRKMQEAAERGDAGTQSYLGWMYAEGKGVTQDYNEAFKWYTKAAEQGNAGAQHDLGWMYQNGKGIPKDDAEAVKWYRKAAEQGNANAQNNLGVMYQNGNGVPPHRGKDSEGGVP